MKQRVADYIADFLVKNGICTCFSVTGGGAMHLNDALGHHAELTTIYNHHESACAIAAEAYCRYSGRIAAVCVTSGPGGTNALTGVLGGWLDSIPMLILSGQVKRAHSTNLHPVYGLRQLGDQEFDITTAVQGMTKYAVTIAEPLDVAYHLEKALFLATSARGGPVWLDIPLDVQGAIIDTDKLHHFDAGDESIQKTPTVSPFVSREILSRIEKAERPLLLIGTGVRLSETVELLRALLDKLQIPVLTAWNAGDTVAFDNPLFAGIPGTVGTRAGNLALTRCDLLLSLGCRLNIRTVGHNPKEFAGNAYKIIVDVDEKELKKPTVIPDMPLHADLRDLLPLLLAGDYTQNKAHLEWGRWCHHLVEHFYLPVEAESGRTGFINPYIFLDILFSHLRGDDRIVCSNGSACVMTFQAARIKNGQRMFTNSGCASMGYGLPAALGVAMAEAGRVICIEGDGSIMMNLQELATVSYHRPNIKILLLNNDGYHSIRQTQATCFGTPLVGINPQTGVYFPDFEKLADAFAIPYQKIDSAASAKKVLPDILDIGGPVLVEIMVDPAQAFSPKVSTVRMPDGSLYSPPLDDMSPLLPRDMLDHLRGGGEVTS